MRGIRRSTEDVRRGGWSHAFVSITIATLTLAHTQAWNHLGAAAELAGRGSQAVGAYRRALNLLEEQGARFGEGSEGNSEEGRCASWKEAVRLARCNMGRALVLKGRAAEAVEFLSESDLGQVGVHGVFFFFFGKSGKRAMMLCP